MDKLNATQICALPLTTNAIVQLWVNWAIHSHQSFAVAKQLAINWNQRNQQLRLGLMQIDLSEQAGEVWEATLKWLESQTIPDSRQLMYCGAGPLLWIRDGTIENVVINPSSTTLDNLMAMTERSFGASNA
jgi:hypothetical protein